MLTCNGAYMPGKAAERCESLTLLNASMSLLLCCGIHAEQIQGQLLAHAKSLAQAELIVPKWCVSHAMKLYHSIIWGNLHVPLVCVYEGHVGWQAVIVVNNEL